MAGKMMAARVHAPGGPDVLTYEEVAKPEPKAGEVLIKVHAAALNPPDWYVRDGMRSVPEAVRPPVSYPVILGSDVSGVVEAVGAKVSDIEIGDRVLALVRFPGLEGGGYAEYITAPATDIARKPDQLDDIRAAALPMAALTAWQFLFEYGHPGARPTPMAFAMNGNRPWRPAPLGEGRVVLVNGAAGGVGHFAVQFAKRTGARVIAVASGKHEAFLRDLGADQFIDYTKTPPEDFPRDVDLVIDTLGGPKGHRFLQVVKRGGMICPIFPGDYQQERADELGITIQCAQVHSDGKELAEIARLVATGALKVGIDQVFPLAEARRAHERVEHGHIQGKIVLEVVKTTSM